MKEAPGREGRRPWAGGNPAKQPVHYGTEVFASTSFAYGNERLLESRDGGPFVARRRGLFLEDHTPHVKGSKQAHAYSFAYLASKIDQEKGGVGGREN